jgi:hypothetical protein
MGNPLSEPIGVGGAVGARVGVGGPGRAAAGGGRGVGISPTVDLLTVLLPLFSS